MQYPNIKNLYVYTSGHEIGEHTGLANILVCGYKQKLVDGFNIAPKDFKDWVGFRNVICYIPEVLEKTSSNRLYVFREMRQVYDSLHIDMSKYNIDIIDRQWTKSFNTPDNEHFARLPILF